MRYLSLAAIAALTACSGGGASLTPSAPQAQPDRRGGLIYCREQDAQVSGSSLERGLVFLSADDGWRFTHVAVTNNLQHASVTVEAPGDPQQAITVAVGQLRGVTERPSARYLELSDGEANDEGEVQVQTKVCRG